MMHQCTLMALLALLLVPNLICGFATPLRTHKIYAHRASRDEVVDLIEIGDDPVDYEFQDLGRRQFFASIVGAASIFVLSESASAIDEFSSTARNSAYVATSDSSKTSTETNPASSEPSVDTRAIFDKAAKKALGGELNIDTCICNNVLCTESPLSFNV